MSRTAKDPYAVLGVPNSATREQIRKAFRKLARTHHPDVNAGNKEAEERFKEVNAAYEVLSNADRRQLYDEFGEQALSSGFDARAARAAAAFSSGPFGAGGRSSAGGGTFAFEATDPFGEALGRTGGGSMTRGAAELRVVVEIDLVDAIRGTEVQLQLPTYRQCASCRGKGEAVGTRAMPCAECLGTGRLQAGGNRIRMATTCWRCSGVGYVRTPCTGCQGSGRVRTKQPVNVRIPQGAGDGSRLRVARQDGDVLLEMRVRPHPFFTREGTDLFLRLPVTLDEAYNGAHVSVPTADGAVAMRIPAGSQNGRRLRLRGKGIARGQARGDLYVDLDVRLPEANHGRFAESARLANTAYQTPVRKDLKL
jgi:molecular chaperone DnaJ